MSRGRPRKYRLRTRARRLYGMWHGDVWGRIEYGYRVDVFKRLGEVDIKPASYFYREEDMVIHEKRYPEGWRWDFHKDVRRPYLEQKWVQEEHSDWLKYHWREVYGLRQLEFKTGRD